MYYWNKSVFCSAACTPPLQTTLNGRIWFLCVVVFLAAAICAVLVWASVLPLSLLHWLKWPSRVCVAFQIENKTANSKLKAGHFDWLSLLVSEHRCTVGRFGRGKTGRKGFFCERRSFKHNIEREKGESVKDPSRHAAKRSATQRIMSLFVHLLKLRLALARCHAHNFCLITARYVYSHFTK